MKLDDLIDKYPEHTKVYRTNVKYFPPESLSICKILRAWGDKELIGMGFVVPQLVIDDANADDWEIYEDEK